MSKILPLPLPHINNFNRGTDENDKEDPEKNEDLDDQVSLPGPRLGQRHRAHSFLGEPNFMLESPNKRVNECHDFAWSRSLWLIAAERVKRTCITLVVAFVLTACLLAYYDGIRGVDVPYFFSATVTTVGFGDFSCRSQFTRAVYVILLPFGLSILGLFIVLVKMYAKALSRSTKDVRTSGELNSMGNAVNNDRVRTNSFVDRGRHMAFGVVDPKFLALSYVRSPWELRANFRANAVVNGAGAFQGTVHGSIFMLLLKYCCVLLVGVIFLMNHSEEDRLQKEEAGEEMTFITTLFWTSVIASTVGYGHHLVPRHDDTKWFFTFYFWFACINVASIIGDMSKLYLRYTEQQIVDKIFDSMLWVHKSDLHRSMKVSQSEYVLFKLRQLNDIDDVMLQRLTVRFTELDLESKGVLKIGLDIPSAQQAKEMLRIAKSRGTEQNLGAVWKEMKTEFVRKVLAEKGLASQVHADAVAPTTDVPPTDVERAFRSTTDEEQPPKGFFVRLIACHTFAWSRKLWREAMRNTAGIGCFLLIGYIGLGAFIVSKENWPGTTGFYVLALTISTVGLGDVAPTKDTSRIAAIIGIPFGLIILGLILSISVEYGRSLPPVLEVEESEREAKLRSVFNWLNADKERELSREDVLDNCLSLGLTRPQAGELFEFLDAEKTGKLRLPKPHPVPWNSAIQWRCAGIAARMYTVVVLGAIMLLYIDGGADRGVTWIDALYFATVAATSVGYGDITVQTTTGRVCMGIFVLTSTLVTAGALKEFAEVYVRDYEGERIVSRIIESSTWVHKADITNSGVITESDYVLFKLQQLQMVSKTTLDNLVDRFFELDITNDGFLDVGVDCPSATQCLEIQEEIAGTHKSLADGWRIKQAGLVEYEMKVRRANSYAQKWKRTAKVEGSGNPIPFSQHPTQSFDTPMDLSAERKDVMANIVAARQHRTRLEEEANPPASAPPTVPTKSRRISLTREPRVGIAVL